MNFLTAVSNGRHGRLNPVSSANRSQLLKALVAGVLWCAPTAAQSRFDSLTTKPSTDAREVKERLIRVEHLRVRYIESGSGPVVVMIHGNAGSVADFNFGAFDLLSANYHVIAVDRPG